MNFIKFFKLLLLSFLINILLIVSLYIQKNNYEQALAINEDRIVSLSENEERLLEIQEQIKNELDNCKRELSLLTSVNFKKREIVLTNYYTGDSEGSTSYTGSGLTTSDFEINELGWYTYDGKIVIAAATYECLFSNYGGCSSYNSLNDVPKGYRLHRYYDELLIKIDGVIYEAIVLDSCGASFWEREYQTYDIFIADKKYAFGKVKGVIYE